MLIYTHIPKEKVVYTIKKKTEDPNIQENKTYNYIVIQALLIYQDSRCIIINS